jgi:Tfp pilus assembly PilM family ATPase
MSKFDELVEQVAFGAETGKGAPCLGMYIGPDVAYLSETRVHNGRLVVDHMVRIPIPGEPKAPGATATMSTEFLSDPTKVGGLIRQSMSQLRWSTKNVRVTLSHHMGLLRYFAMPAVEKRFLRTAVPLEAKKYIPIPFDILAHDYSAGALSPDASGRQRLGVLIAVTQKRNVAHVRGLLNLLGLNMVGLEVAPCSALRLWQTADPPRDGAPYAHVHIDGGSVRVMVVDRGVPVFFREVFLGQQTTTADMRKIDLSGCLSFVGKQLGLTTVSRLHLSGNLPDMTGLADAFGAETGLGVSIHDTPRLLGIKSGDWGGYASLGASIQPPPAAAAPLDLAASGRVTEEERRTARDILLAGAAAALFFAGAGLLKSAECAYTDGQLRKYQKRMDPEVAAALNGLSPADIDATLKDMKLQLAQLQALSGGGRRLRVSAILKEVIDTMPEKLWIERLSVANDLASADKPLDITLRGHVMDKGVPEEQALAFNFKDSLLRNAVLGKMFDITIEVHTAEESPAGAATDSAALAQMLEKRTQFALHLVAKK